MLSLQRTAAAIAALGLAGAAQADTPFFQSASFIDEAVANGDYSLDSSRFLGAVFTVNQAEAVSAIGGNFTQYGDGNAIFGAIVRLSPNATLPGNLAANTVAETLFTPTGGDQSVAVSTVLQPGRYAVVFGSGLFGATGSSGLVAGQAALGTPSFVQYGGAPLAASRFTDDTLRVTVNAVAAVPEPATALLWATGALALGLVRRRRA